MNKTKTLTGDGFLASGAQGTPLGVVVGLAVGQTFQLEETTVCERCHTLATHETLRMPLLVQR